MRRRIGTTLGVAGAVVAVSVTAVAGPAWAAGNRTWEGDAGSAWSTAGNWVGDNPPADPPGDDTAVFPAGATSFTPNQDNAADFSVAGLRIEASDYRLTGNRTVVGDTIVADYATSGISRVSMPIGLGSAGVAVSVDTGDELQMTGVLSNQGVDASVDKTGSGLLVMSADNTYTGGTDVQGGTLEVTGAASLASGATVASGATFVLAGDVTGTVEVGGTFELTGQVVGDVDVDSGGTLLTGSGDIDGFLAMASSSTFGVTLAGTSHDALDVADGATLEGNNVTLDVEIGPGGVTPGNAYTILANSGETTGTFAGLPEGATFPVDGQEFTITYEGGTTGEDIVLTAEGAPPGEVTRIGGPTRVQTGILVSRDSYPAADSAEAVVLARDDVFADALAGTPLAVSVDGPLLINPTAALDPGVLAEIQRVLGDSGTIHVLGGTAAVSQAVVTALQAEGYVVERIGGATRYDTAVGIAQALGTPAALILATGLDFADALTAGTAAAVAGGAVLLTDGTQMPAVTQAYLDSRPGTALFAAGGPANTASGGSATPLVGADRYATGVAVAEEFFSGPTGVGVASGISFPDALTGGANAAVQGYPMLLTDPASLSAATAAYIEATATVERAVIYGGTAAVSGAVQTALEALLA